MRKLTPLFVFLTILSGCTMVPHYDRPDAPVGATWPGDDGSLHSDPAIAANIGWKDFFNDPRLQKLIDLALVNNRDLRVASLNVEKARAQYRIKRADLFPNINGTGGADYERVSKAMSTTGVQMDTQSYSLGVGFTSYELDLFGRIRSLKRQALEQYFSLQQTQTSVQLTLVSEVASAYLTLLADQDLLKLTQDTLKSQRDSYDLQKQSFDHDIGTELDLQQAETSVRSAEASLAQYKRAVSEDMNALVLLIGSPLPKDLQESLNDPSGVTVPGLLTELPAGLPSDLLTRRPDILAAEYNLKAANANIGAARAAFFPTITLTTGIGTSSTGLSGLFANGTGFWSFAPQIRLPIFDGGVNAANLDVARISKKIEIAQYEKTVQTAFKEVADGLAARGTFQDQLKAQEQLVQSTEKSYHLYELRYNNGVDNYLNVLIWQRSNYAAQQGLIQTRLAYLNNLVTLYKALGGGWTDTAKPAN